MPAVARPTAAAKAAPKPAPQAPAKRGRGGKRAPPSPAYAPAKLEAARGMGLAPKAAVGVACLVILAVLATALFTGDRMTTVQRGLERTTAAGMGALGFGVKAVHIQGASPETRAAVLKALAVDRGDNILGVDLDAVRGRVEAVSWVEDAKVVRLLPDTLVVAVTERRPLAVWQNQGRLALVDAQGQPIAGADASNFPQLPLVVGPGAGQAAGAVLPLLHARPALMEQVEALVRVDHRRWDLRLRDGALIQLPALDEADALIRLDALEARSRVLSLGFAKIDLRDPDLIAVRPREGASRPAPPIVTRAAAPAPAPALSPLPQAAPAAAGL